MILGYSWYMRCQHQNRKACLHTKIILKPEEKNKVHFDKKKHKQVPECILVFPDIRPGLPPIYHIDRVPGQNSIHIEFQDANQIFT